MTYYIDIQHASKAPLSISDQQLIEWVSLSLKHRLTRAEVTLRLVEAEEITDLNQRYRMQNKATNVLAFPSTLPDVVQLEHPFLGDVIICPEVLAAESQQLEKSLTAHWAHIVIHGILHLLKYDHLNDHDTAIMQQREIELLNQLGFSNPYDAEDNYLE